MPEKITRQCSHCGKDFEPARRDVRYCSGTCRQRAKRQRRLSNAGDELHQLLRGDPDRP